MSEQDKNILNKMNVNPLKLEVDKIEQEAIENKKKEDLKIQSHVHHGIKEVDSLAEVASSTSEESEYISELSGNNDISSTVPDVSAVSIVPIVGDFIRGLIFLKESWSAINEEPGFERNIKIATGVFAGLASVGFGVVNSLFLAHVGLLATATAMTIVPVVGAAVVAGVYAAAAFRDGYSWYKINNEIKEYEKQEPARILRIKELEKKANSKTLNKNKALKNDIVNYKKLKENQSKLYKLRKSRSNAISRTLTSSALAVGGGLILAGLAIVATGGLAVAGMAVAGAVIMGSVAILRFSHRVYLHRKERQKKTKSSEQPSIDAHNDRAGSLKSSLDSTAAITVLERKSEAAEPHHLDKHTNQSLSVDNQHSSDQVSQAALPDFVKHHGVVGNNEILDHNSDEKQQQKNEPPHPHV